MKSRRLRVSLIMKFVVEFSKSFDVAYEEVSRYVILSVSTNLG